jgi:hypothetical protein
MSVGAVSSDCSPSMTCHLIPGIFFLSRILQLWRLRSMVSQWPRFQMQSSIWNFLIFMHDDSCCDFKEKKCSNSTRSWRISISMNFEKDRFRRSRGPNRSSLRKHWWVVCSWGRWSEFQSRRWRLQVSCFWRRRTGRLQYLSGTIRGLINCSVSFSSPWSVGC